MSFYQFILKFKDSQEKVKLAQLAERVHQDIAFPKHEDDFETISHYLETSSTYSLYLSTFDQAWDLYKSNQ